MSADYCPFRAMARAPPCPSKCIIRVQKELKRMAEDPYPAIHVFPDPNESARASCFHALVEGPDETPYEKGLFWFFLYCPPEFPFGPPKAKLMSTGGGTVRFNPNLYNDGKVCLSILGTYEGPGWSPVTGLKGVMLSIQSLLCEQPHMNEPGMRNPAAAVLNRYFDTLRYESIAEAACAVAEHGAASKERLPPELLRRARELFLRNADWYIEQCTAERQKSDGRPMGELQFQSWQTNKKTFQWAELRRRVQRLKAQFANDGVSPAPPLSKTNPMLEKPPGAATRSPPSASSAAPPSADATEKPAAAAAAATGKSVEPAKADEPAVKAIKGSSPKVEKAPATQAQKRKRDEEQKGSGSSSKKPKSASTATPTKAAAAAPKSAPKSAGGAKAAAAAPKSGKNTAKDKVFDKKVAQLMDMGFGKAAAAAALKKSGGDVTKASVALLG